MANDPRVLVHPTRAELNDTLNEATKAANQGCKTQLLPSPMAGQTRFLKEMEALPEGWHQWNGGEGLSQRGRGTRCSVVYAAWWTDYGGRRHVLVGGQRSQLGGLYSRHCLTGKPEPPLSLIYPQHVLFRTLQGRRELLACCDCGVYGVPESIGWMGTCCGACHDLREAGSTPCRNAVGPGCIPHAHPEFVNIIAFSPDGNTLASSGGGNSIRLWDVKTGASRTALPCGDGTLRPEALAFSPDGRTLVSGNTRPFGPFTFGGFTFWNVRKGRAESHLPVENGMCDYLRYTADSRVLAAVRGQARKLWLAEPGHLDSAFPATQAPLVAGVDLAPDGRALATAHGNTVRVWDLTTRTQQARFEIGGELITSLAYSPDGTVLALGTLFGVLLWDLASHQARARWSIPPVSGLKLRFASDGRILVARSEERVLAWDVETGAERAVLDWLAAFAPRDLQFAPDGRSFATAHSGGAIRFWPVEILGGV
jgi:hypothetical protein